MKLINANELISNLIMEFGDDNNEITKFWLDKIEEEINTCRDYSQYIEKLSSIEDAINCCEDCEVHHGVKEFSEMQCYADIVDIIRS